MEGPRAKKETFDDNNMEWPRQGQIGQITASPAALAKAVCYPNDGVFYSPTETWEDHGDGKSDAKTEFVKRKPLFNCSFLLQLVLPVSTLGGQIWSFEPSCPPISIR